MMIRILLLPNFDAQFLTQLSHEITNLNDKYELVGLTNRSVRSACGLDLTPHLGISDLATDDSTVIIPDCDAPSLLLTEPRIHRLIQTRRETDNIFVAPDVAATLARIGVRGARVVRTGQEFTTSLALQSV